MIFTNLLHIMEDWTMKAEENIHKKVSQSLKKNSGFLHQQIQNTISYYLSSINSTCSTWRVHKHTFINTHIIFGLKDLTHKEVKWFDQGRKKVVDKLNINMLSLHLRISCNWTSVAYKF